MASNALADRVGPQLAPLAFTALASGRAFVRKRGKNRHRVEFSGPDGVIPSLVFEDAAVRQLVKDWRAGGVLTGPAFAFELGSNQVKVAAFILAQLSFFEWLEMPETVARDVACRYVPGFIDPSSIVPYVMRHLGPDGVERYATGLLSGRSELAPAFISELRTPTSTASRNADHGTQLAQALRRFAPAVRPNVPDGVVPSPSPLGRNLRCFFGRQLRAWGEPAAARALSGLDDETIQRLYRSQAAIRTPVTKSVEAVQLVLAAVDADRPPALEAPDPRFFQYHARHVTPFMDPS
jgi:hypothetical protein